MQAAEPTNRASPEIAVLTARYMMQTATAGAAPARQAEYRASIATYERLAVDQARLLS